MPLFETRILAGNAKILALIGVSVAVLVGVASGCGTGRDVRVNRCVTLSYSSLGIEQLPKSARALISPTEVREGLRVFCGAASDAGLLNSNGDVSKGKAFVALLHRKPEIFRPFCLPIADAARASIPPDGLKYITNADFRRYGVEICRVAPFYVRSDGHLDTELLFRQHPTIFAPFMVAGMLSEYDKNPAAFGMSRSLFRAKARAFIVEAIRTGVYVNQGGASFKVIRGPKYQALLRKYFG